ncbi:MAG: M14 family metallopeptidase [Bacteroidales bacterium]|nr:M14 family metallopeptidase [Bacteroidales bacterium]
MKISLKILLLTVIGFVLNHTAEAQNQYNNYRTMLQKVDALTRDYPSLCSSRSLVKTIGGKDILVITIGAGDKDSKPGIAVLGGVEGSHILGKELALGFAVSLLKESDSLEIKNLLNKITFYVFPDVSPDATEQFFSEVKYERNVNARQTDDDRDFTSGEDPYEDLNNDGFITLIRVSDPAGNYMENEEDKRVMIPADLSKGQKGSYFVYSEGTDNDKDDKFNEDGAGGVSFNRNLTFNYEEFGLNAGLYPVSEAESKAVLDFLFDHFNIFATFAFGPQDNLGQSMKSSERPGAVQSSPQMQIPGQGQMRIMDQERRITSILKSDELINKLVSDKYHEITGVKGAPSPKSSPGNFMEWSYSHYGRYSFSTPAWWFPVERDKNADVAFLKFADENKMDGVFVPWTEIKHPGFPGKKTETGGIKPFATINPPADKLEDLVSKNYKFILAIAEMHPELEFLDIIVENKGDNIFRLSLKVHNIGIFATCAEAGEFNMWTRIMRISLETAGSQKFLSGQKVQRIPRLEGDKSADFSWLISGRGSVKITAGAVNTGQISTSVELK